MKKIITLSILFAHTFAFAQTTYNLDWAVGVSEEDSSITIEIGDTVEWTWTDTLPHTVTSKNDAVEQFDSGTLTGMGQTFSYTFTQEGINDYECEVHSNMDGTITVLPNLGIESKFSINVNYFPNPIVNELTVTSLFVLDSVSVFDVQGKELMSENVNTNILKVDFSGLDTGVYFVSVQSSNMNKTFQVVKR